MPLIGKTNTPTTNPRPPGAAAYVHITAILSAVPCTSSHAIVRRPSTPSAPTCHLDHTPNLEAFHPAYPFGCPFGLSRLPPTIYPPARHSAHIHDELVIDSPYSNYLTWQFVVAAINKISARTIHMSSNHIADILSRWN
ncbi:hypothetical protein FIBSPDRAFT_963580 [Athelia psychrophila]|uniref:Uncharacterized protein n=1 Tax=Athelia psychrophila TaxID=1759441 RepID=A0A165YU03_9AGAM|nr:hypothetical protein FIBSPDRAFT_963580 [Fibularhizoctonia sp. CBS 109695]